MAPAHARRMVSGSPAWKPQAMFALVTMRQQGLVVAEPPGAEALAEVGVQVDDVRARMVTPRLLRRKLGERGGDRRSRRCPAARDDVDQRVQHRVPVLAEVEQALRGFPELRRVAAPQPVGQGQVPVDVRRVGAPGPMVSSWSAASRIAAVPRAGRVERGQVGAAVVALQHAGTRTPGGAAPPGRSRAAAGPPAAAPGRTSRVAVDAGERAHRVEHRVQRRADRLGVPSPARGPAQRTQAASTCGMACCSAGESSTLRGSQSSRKVSALAGLIRSGRPKSWSQP